MLTQQYAIKQIPKEAEQGKAEFQEIMGQSFTKAADQGHGQAQFNLGVCYHKGEGVDKSDAMAKEWLQKAAAQGVQEAIMACAPYPRRHKLNSPNNLHSLLYSLFIFICHRF